MFFRICSKESFKTRPNSPYGGKTSIYSLLQQGVAEEALAEPKEEITESGVVVLTSANFDAEIKEGVTFVSFMNPDSDDWKSLAPIWEQLPKKLEGIKPKKIKIGRINAGQKSVYFLSYLLNRNVLISNFGKSKELC